MSGVRKIISFGKEFKFCISELGNLFNTNIRISHSLPGFGGGEGEMMNMIVQGLGENFDYYIPDVVGYTQYSDNGTQTGCQGLLQRKQVDALLAASAVHLNYSEFGIPLLSYWSTQPVFVTKTPDLLPKYDVLLKTFDPSSFIAIGVTLLLISLVFYFLTGRKESYVNHLISKFAEMVLQEPFVKIRMTLPVELLTTTWVLGAQFITLFFQAIILTALLLPRYMSPIDDLNKLWRAIEKREYKVVSLNYNPDVAYLLKSSDKENEQRIGSIIFENNWLMTVQRENVISVMENNSAIVMSDLMRRALIPERYPVTLNREPIHNALDLCVYISRSFPLKKKFIRVMWRIIESGIQKRTVDRYFFNVNLKDFKNVTWETQPAWRPLTLEDLQGPFMLLAVGLFISLVVLVWEMIIYRIVSCRKKSSVSIIN